MALYKQDGFISILCGTFGCEVFSHKPDGNHVAALPRRIRRAPSAAQIKRRAAFLATCNAWHFSLTDAQRNLWTSYGQRHPRTGPTGHHYTMTGRHAFFAINITRAFNDLPPLLEPPAD